MKKETTVESLENEFMTSLRRLGLQIAPEATCHFVSYSIELGIKGENEPHNWPKQGSEIVLFACTPATPQRRRNEISFYASGCFTPDEKENFWRCVHAAEILKNWDAVVELVNRYTTLYNNYKREQEQNEQL